MGGSENEAFLAAIMAQKEGRPDWRRAGRDFPTISRKSMKNLWELTAPYFFSLVADRGYFKDFERFKDISASHLKGFKKFLKYRKEKILCDFGAF